MFHFWFNTYFVEDEELIPTTVSNGGQQQQQHAPSTPPTSTNHTPTFPIRWGSGRGKHVNSAGAVADSDRLHLISTSLVSYKAHAQTHSLTASLDSGVDKTAKIHDPLHRNGQYENPAGGGGISGGGGPMLTAVQKQQALAAAEPAPPPRYYKTLTLAKPEIDKANKDKQHKLFSKDFKVHAQSISLVEIL